VGDGVPAERMGVRAGRAGSFSGVRHSARRMLHASMTATMGDAERQREYRQ